MKKLTLFLTLLFPMISGKQVAHNGHKRPEQECEFDDEKWQKDDVQKYLKTTCTSDCFTHLGVMKNPEKCENVHSNEKGFLRKITV